MEEWDKAIPCYEVCRKYKTKFVYSFTQLADSYSAKGMYDKAEEILEDHIQNISDHFAIRQQLAYQYLDQGKFDLALAEVDKALYLDPAHYENFMIKGDIYLYRGEFEKAIRYYDHLKGMIELKSPITMSFSLYLIILSSPRSWGPPSLLKRFLGGDCR